MAGLIPGQKGQPGQTDQADQGTAGLYRRSQLVLGAAFVMLVGAVVAFALHARVVGIVLLVLMLLGGMASFSSRSSSGTARWRRRGWPGRSRRRGPPRPASRPVPAGIDFI